MSASYDPLNNYGTMPPNASQNSMASLPPGIANPNAQAISALAVTLPRIYPVGSVYMSTIPTNPADKTVFGFGTWAPIQDMMLIGVGTTYVAGSVTTTLLQGTSTAFPSVKAVFIWERIA